MNYQTLKTGQWFRFLDPDRSPAIWQYRGNGWFGRPYTGGPWHIKDNPRVEVVVSEPKEYQDGE